MRWLTTTSDRTALGDLLVDSARAITEDIPQSRAAFAWFRDTAAEIAHHRDGLTLDGQGLDAVTLTVAKLLPRDSRTAGDTFWLTQTRTVQTATAAAYGVITVADAGDVVQRLNGGRLLQRVHLAATAAGLGLQHMNQITERIDRDLAQGAVGSVRGAIRKSSGNPWSPAVGHLPRRLLPAVPPTKSAPRVRGGAPMSIHGRNRLTLGRALLAARWSRVLLSVLGIIEMLAAVSATQSAIISAGVVGGALVAVTPWVPVHPPVLLLALVVGAVPFATLTWSSLATPLIALLAVGIGSGQLHSRGRTKTRPAGSHAGDTAG